MIHKNTELEKKNEHFAEATATAKAVATIENATKTTVNANATWMRAAFSDDSKDDTTTKANSPNLLTAIKTKAAVLGSFFWIHSVHCYYLICSKLIGRVPFVLYFFCSANLCDHSRYISHYVFFGMTILSLSPALSCSLAFFDTLINICNDVWWRKWLSNDFKCKHVSCVCECYK